MSDGTNTRTIPPIARHYRLPALLLWGYLVMKSMAIWSAHTEPHKAYYIREYIRSSFLPSHFAKHQVLFDLWYHQPAWRELLPVIIVDVILFLILYGLAWRLDYRAVLALRGGHQISGPRLHHNIKKFQRAICKQ
jgi:hypothetical protein